MKTVVFLIFVCFISGFLAEVPDYTNDVECNPKFYDNKARLEFTFDPNNPKLDNITNGKFTSQNYSNISRIDLMLQKSKSDGKYFLEIDILYPYTTYLFHVNFMNNNFNKNVKICEFNSTEIYPFPTPFEETSYFFRGDCEIHINWKKFDYSVRKKEIFKELYKITTSDNDQEVIKTNNFSTVYNESKLCDLRKQNGLNISIQTYIGEKQTNETSNLHIPSDKHILPFPQHFNGIYENESYHFTWEKPKLNEQITKYKIFSCDIRNNFKNCDSLTYHGEYNSTQFSATIKSTFGDKVFAIGAYSNNSQGPLYWPKCTDEARIELKSQTASTISIKWTIKCDVIYKTKIIQLYINSTNPKINFSSFQNVTANETEFTFINLKPSTRYNIEINALMGNKTVKINKDDFSVSTEAKFPIIYLFLFFVLLLIIVMVITIYIKTLRAKRLNDIISNRQMRELKKEQRLIELRKEIEIMELKEEQRLNDINSNRQMRELEKEQILIESRKEIEIMELKEKQKDLTKIQELWNDMQRYLKLQTIKREDLLYNKPLGEGYYGKIDSYFWINPETNRREEVAVKEFKIPAGANAKSLNKKIVGEAYNMCSMSNKYILRIIGICINESSYMLITELMPLGDLKHFLHNNKNTIGSKQLLTWASQIVDGLTYISSQNKIHGDLAARNILIRDKTQVLISDFGMSDIKSSYGVVAIAWAAPEVERTLTYTAETDVWSLGVLLWELFSFGADPYDRVTEKLFQRINNGHRLPHIKSNWNEKVQKILDKCWLLDPELRIKLPKMKAEFTLMLENPSDFFSIKDDEIKNEEFQELLNGKVECSEDDKVRDNASNTGRSFLNLNELYENTKSGYTDF